jgi:hypothetical protein
MTSLLVDIACRKFRKFLVEFLELQEAAATYCMGKKLIQIIQIKCTLSFGTAKNKTSQPNLEFYSKVTPMSFWTDFQMLNLQINA